MKSMKSPDQNWAKKLSRRRKSWRGKRPKVKNDLEVLQMRGALDPKRFYKKNASKELPKYFQVGRYVNNPVEFYSDRGTAKNKKKSLVDELMADAEFQRYNKRKYTEIIADKAKQMNKRDQKKFAKKSKLK